jgi:hypothetical protein
MTRRPLLPCALAVSALLAACAPDRAVAPDAAHPPTNPSLAQGVSAEKRAAGGITIVLDVTPDVFVDVPFTMAGKKVGDFTLDDDADPALSNTITFDKAKPGTYAVQMGAVVGAALQTITCASEANGGDAVDNNSVDVATRTATIQLEKGEAVTCTFAGAGGWQNGDFRTLSQLAWGNPSSTNPTLFGGYDAVYRTGVVEVGVPDAAGFSMVFTMPLAVSDYLPASGLPAPLNVDVLVNPTSTASGVLGGEVLALQLNVDFADVGVTLGTTGLAFGDLTMCNLGAPVDGIRVRDFLALANTALGGGSTSGVSLNGYVSVLEELNNAFVLGVPSAFAQESLVYGACP